LADVSLEGQNAATLTFAGLLPLRFQVLNWGSMKRVAGIVICYFALALSANAAELPSPDKAVWHWFSTCANEKTLSIEITLGKKSIFKSSFPLCKMRRTKIKPGLVPKHLAFSLENKKRSYFGEVKGEMLEGNIWESGAEPDNIVLGLTFETKTQTWLHTLLVVEPDKPSRFLLGKGLVVTTHPEITR
jgi:hypothetical protein